MKKICALILCFLFTTNAFATAIVIYITPDFVIMAADSRGRFTEAKTLKQNVTSVSKIYQSGSAYFSLSGLVSNNVQEYDASRLISDELRKSNDIKTSINNIKQKLKSSITKYLNHQKKNNPTLYKKNVSGDNYFFTSVGIITIVNKKPYAHILGFRIVNEKDLTIAVDEVAYNGSRKDDAVYYLGTTGEINRYMDTVQHIKTEPTLFVEKLITVQANKTPEAVGLPIDIIKLTPKETIWIKKQKTTPVIIK